MSEVKALLEKLKKEEVRYVDFRFTDPLGQWHHLAHAIETVDEDLLTEGVMFDGSSIAGWKAINESDMTLMPDCAISSAMRIALRSPASASPSSRSARS